MHAKFRFQYLYECKRCPERFLSNSQLQRHIKASYIKKSTEISKSASPTAPTTPTSQQASRAPPSPSNTPKSLLSPPNSPVPAPTAPEKILILPLIIKKALQTLLQMPAPLHRREISASTATLPIKLPARPVKLIERSLFVYLLP